tara:strand:- start:156 stop:674 length:519 start_codon:yes stop_codon:yes gene_type:complete
MLDWSYYPKTDPLPDFLNDPIKIFENNFPILDSSKDNAKNVRSSDDVLKLVTREFQDLDYEIETGKKRHEKVRVPVLYSHRGLVSQAFEVDGWHKGKKIVLEVESGRAVVNHQFLKDIFEASVMVDVDFLIIAVRQIYKGTKDYKKITDWLDTLFITNRIKLSLKGILLIGY